MFERRTHIRVPAGIEGSYQPFKLLAAPRLGITQDLGLGGMRFSSAERLQPGEKVSIELTLPQEGSVGIRAVVLWCREAPGAMGGYESGLRWTDLEPAAQARLNAFLTSYTRSRAGSVIAASLTAPRQVHWPRTLALALLLSFLAFWAAQSWVSWHILRIENRSLNLLVESYQAQIKKQFPPY